MYMYVHTETSMDHDVCSGELGQLIWDIHVHVYRVVSLDQCT